MKTMKFKPSEVGPIPVDWEVKRLGEIGEPLMCKRILKSQTSDSGEVPFYKISTFGKLADAYITRELFSSFKRQYSYPQKGDILISAAGTIGRTVEFDGNDAYFQDSNIVWIGHDESVVYNKYLKWCYTGIKWQTEDGGIVTRLYNNNLRNSLIPVPPRPEQEKIAEALSDVDALRAAMTKLIEKKRAIKQGAMQQLLTGKKRLAGFTGKWVEKRFDDCFEHIASKEYQIQSTDYLNGGHYEVVDQGQNDVVGYTNDKAHLFKVPHGGVIIFGDHTRIVKYRQKDFVVGADGTQLLVGKEANTRFLSMVLQCKDIPNLGYARHFKFVKEGRYHLPSTLAEQQAIAAVLSDMDAEIAALEAKRAKYECIKQGMMQELLTGKTRLA